MSSYNEQRKSVSTAIGILNAKTKVAMPNIEMRALNEVAQSITKAENLEKVLREIFQCAHKNGEFCVHCDSIAKIIEEFQK